MSDAVAHSAWTLANSKSPVTKPQGGKAAKATELTVWDNLMIYGRYFDLPRSEIRARAEELLQFVQLSDRRDSRVDPLHALRSEPRF